MPPRPSVLQLLLTADVDQQRCGCRRQAEILLDTPVSYAKGFLLNLEGGYVKDERHTVISAFSINKGRDGHLESQYPAQFQYHLTGILVGVVEAIILCDTDVVSAGFPWLSSTYTTHAQVALFLTLSLL
jgi:hypothetical protein